MTVFANIKPTPKVDGIDYCIAKAVPAAEADLQDTDQSSVPPGSGFEQAIFAIVQLTVTGGPATNSTYVVLQTDLGDGVWVDVAWVLSIITTGTAIFVIQGGSNGARAFASSRASGTAPGATGNNSCALGGRFRFVAKATLTGGTTPAVTATIRYRLYDYPGSV